MQTYQRPLCWDCTREWTCRDTLFEPTECAEFKALPAKDNAEIMPGVEVVIGPDCMGHGKRRV